MSLKDKFSFVKDMLNFGWNTLLDKPVMQEMTEDGAAIVEASAGSKWAYGAWPADRHDEQSGAGTNAADVLFQTTDSTNFNEHIIEITAGACDLTVKANSDTAAYRNVYVEDMAVASPVATMITGVALPVGIYKLKGSFSSIKLAQNGATATAAKMASYCK